MPLSLSLHLCLFLTVTVIVSADVYQPVANGCGQRYIYVNGVYRPPCAGGYLDMSNRCIAYTTPQCPAGYILVNGFCYMPSALPREVCSPGYMLINNLCYPQTITGCTNNPTPPSTSAPPTPPPPPPEPEIEEPEPNTELLPEPDPSTRCPPGSIFMHEQCRRILCSAGEHYAGRCFESACPAGTVWRGRRCQEPGYVTTIIQVDNVFVNELRHTPGKVVESNINNVHTPKPVNIVVTPLPPTAPRPVTQEPRPTKPPTRRPPPPPPPQKPEQCCTVLSPRMCKQYDHRWLCFNRRSKLCDSRICTQAKVYLKPPQIWYDSQLLIMPPNPPLGTCSKPNCGNYDTIDCSGCEGLHPEACSPQCYQYPCPNGDCNYVDLHDYCRSYPGEFGCRQADGCVWDWCN